MVGAAFFNLFTFQAPTLIICVFVILCRNPLFGFDGAKVRRFLLSAKLFQKIVCANSRIVDQSQRIAHYSFFYCFSLKHAVISWLFRTFAPNYVHIFIYNKEKSIMDHQFLAVHYQLHSVKDGERTLEEQTSREHPFQFISGFGVSLDAFRKALSIANLYGAKKKKD